MLTFSILKSDYSFDTLIKRVTLTRNTLSTVLFDLKAISKSLNLSRIKESLEKNFNFKGVYFLQN